MTVAQRLNELGIELATPRPPQANYVPAVRTGNLVFLSGTGPYLPDGGLVTGKVGGELTDRLKQRLPPELREQLPDDLGSRVEQGLNILENLAHRGAVGADALMGDGAAHAGGVPRGTL